MAWHFESALCPCACPLSFLWAAGTQRTPCTSKWGGRPFAFTLLADIRWCFYPESQQGAVLVLELSATEQTAGTMDEYVFYRKSPFDHFGHRVNTTNKQNQTRLIAQLFQIVGRITELPSVPASGVLLTYLRGNIIRHNIQKLLFVTFLYALRGFGHPVYVEFYILIYDFLIHDLFMFNTHLPILGEWSFGAHYIHNNINMFVKAYISKIQEYRVLIN